MAIKNLQQFNQDADMYGEDLVNLVNTPATSQKTIQPVAAPVAAASIPAKNTGADFLAQVNANPAYGRHNIALEALGKFANFTGDSVTPEFRQLLNTPYGNAESGDYTGNELLSTTPTYNQNFVNALQGYKFTPTSDVERKGYQITAPDGRSTVINWGDKSTSFDKLMEVAIPMVISGMAGGALAGPLLGGLGVAAPGTIATGIASGGISGGLNAGIQGGDVLKGILMGGVGGGIGGAASPFASSVAKDIVGAGGPAFLADAAKGAITSGARALPGAVASGNFSNVLTEALSGGVGSGVSSAVGNVLPDKITGNSNVDSAIVKGIGGLAGGLAKAGVTGGNVDVVNSLLPAVAQGISDEYKLPLKQVEAGLGIASKALQGKDLTPADLANIASSFGAGSKTNQTSPKVDAGAGDSFDTGEGDDGGVDDILYPADSQTEVPLIDEELGFSDYTSPTAPALSANLYNPVPREITAIQPTTEVDVLDYLNSLPQDIIGSIPDFGAQQVAVTGKLPDGEFPVVSTPTGEYSNITQGTEGNKVVVTGKKLEGNPYNPTPREVTAIQPLTEVDVGNYLDSLSRDVYNTIPTVSAPSPSPSPSPAPSPSPSSSLAPNIPLAGSGQAPVSSQVLANMGRFDVDSLSQFLQEQKRNSAQQQPQQQSEQQQLFAMLEAMGFKG